MVPTPFKVSSLKLGEKVEASGKLFVRYVGKVSDQFYWQFNEFSKSYFNCANAELVSIGAAMTVLMFMLSITTVMKKM